MAQTPPLGSWPTAVGRLPNGGVWAIGPAGLLPLFLISAASVAYETALTRYFAVAKWSEYGYWVISIVMAGLALSGVFVALARPWLLRRRAALMTWLPVALVGSAALGFWLATCNPFNPLQLQNPATWQPQLWNIGLYYVYLLPFFFLTGLYISLTFVANPDRVSVVYAADLTGAGFGALLVLGLMAVVQAFVLVPCLLVVLAVAAIGRSWRSWRAVVAAVLVLVAGEALLLGANRAAYNDFKAIYAPLHVPNGRVLAQLAAPRGDYTLMDDFTERLDTDVSNDASLLGVPGPPRTYGVYRDGNRVAALPKRDVGMDVRYAAATLGALPYALRPSGDVLLAGPSGGFRANEAVALGAARVLALEPDPVLRAAERHGWGSATAGIVDRRITLAGASPVAAALAARRAGRRFDIVDISGDFLDESEADQHAFTAQAIAAYVSVLKPGGVLSIPVSIREFPAYAVRMLATVRAGLALGGIGDAPGCVVVVRSAWNVRVLVRGSAWTADEIAYVRRWADDRSFDVSWYRGIDVAAARAGIYNDLPAVDFERGQTIDDGGAAQDAVADEAGAALSGGVSASARSFDLAPITESRPYYYDVLRLSRLGLILKRIELLPQAEIGPLVNLAVLAQAVVLAGFVLAVPWVARLAGVGGARVPMGVLARSGAYFAALGLGFLFIEIAAIEKAAFLLNDRASAFSLVLTAMLVGSGLGALLSGRFGRRPWLAVAGSVAVVAVWCAVVALAGDGAVLAASSWPAWLRGVGVVVALAPVAVALGVPFPLGLARAGRASPFLLPWAWALNGAFSVVATPLANLVATKAGLGWLLAAAALVYMLAAVLFAGAPVLGSNAENRADIIGAAVRRDAE